MAEIALVTGSNAGIGFEIAKQLLAKGFFVLIGCRNVSSGEQARGKLDSNNCEVVDIDVSNDDSITRSSNYVLEKYGKLDVLVNNAGIGVSSDPNATTRRHFTDVMNVNVAGVAITIDRFIPLLKMSKQPRIINISSARGSMTRNSSPNFPPTASLPYTLSKVAVNLLTIDYSKKYPEIKVNAVSPGRCATALNGFQGQKTASDGAKCAVSLACLEEMGTGGFWEMEGDSTAPTKVEW